MTCSFAKIFWRDPSDIVVSLTLCKIGVVILVRRSRKWRSGVGDEMLRLKRMVR